mmetsp:Transcript_36858/g.41172  ORF Transcript_36858/g.41172 Transcript_36858/m.41172 type:complete len:85 (+) Transcript_36858:1027-1281(+)
MPPEDGDFVSFFPGHFVVVNITIGFISFHGMFLYILKVGHGEQTPRGATAYAISPGQTVSLVSVNHIIAHRDGERQNGCVRREQ